MFKPRHLRLLIHNGTWIKGILKGQTEPCVLHTDQGSVYASKAYNDLIKDTVLVRSMSRAGKPTDNPVNEALNGWIKEELYVDFKLESLRDIASIKEAIANYIVYYNTKRPCLQSDMTRRPTIANAFLRVNYPGKTLFLNDN